MGPRLAASWNQSTSLMVGSMTSTIEDTLMIPSHPKYLEGTMSKRIVAHIKRYELKVIIAKVMYNEPPLGWYNVGKEKFSHFLL